MSKKLVDQFVEMTKDGAILSEDMMEQLQHLEESGIIPKGTATEISARGIHNQQMKLNSIYEADP